MTYSAIGYAYLELSNAKLALADLDAALAASGTRLPSNTTLAYTYYARGVAERMLGRKSAAQLDIARAEKLYPVVGQGFAHFMHR